jgi:hypothetical protein
MCPIKFEELDFEHIVEFAKDATVFATARDKVTGRLRIFLFHTSTGNTYGRNGRADSWEEFFGSARDSLIACITRARSNNIPVYKINGGGPQIN